MPFRLLLVSWAMLGPLAFAGGGPAVPEECVAGFCLISGPTISRSTFVSKYGGGCEPIGERVPGDRSLRYHVPEQSLWVWFGFDHHDEDLDLVFVTKEPLCQRPRKAKTRLAEFVTSKGIRLGISGVDVGKIYGSPHRIDNAIEREARDPLYSRSDSELAAKYGSPVHMYFAPAWKKSLLFVALYFKGDTVHSFVISNSE